MSATCSFKALVSLQDKYIINKAFMTFAVVADWLRRWICNPIGVARTGSNPVFILCARGYIYRQY